MGGTLYELIGCPASASAAELKRAYHKQCLKVHPDKNVGDPLANDRFQKYAAVSCSTSLFRIGRAFCSSKT